jgi:DNA-binding CsgD family transcriptional regulator
MSHVEHLLREATPAETREPAARMLEAIREIDDPALEARIHDTMAACYEAYGEFERVEQELERAVRSARDANDYSILALMLYNNAAFKVSVPDLAACVKLLDEVDALVEQYGLRRYLVPTRCQRALAMGLQGDLQGAATVLAALDNVAAEGHDAWFRAIARSRISLFSGDFDAALAAIDPSTVGVATPEDAENVVQIAMLRAAGLIWKGEIEGARRAVDAGRAAMDRHSDIYWHGWLAVVATRVEADAAVLATASQSVDLIEHAQARADIVVGAWNEALAQLHSVHPLAEAYSRAIDAEMARLAGADIASRARAAAEAFDGISMPYYVTYFRMREAEAMLEGGSRPLATEILRHARGTARLHGFAGLDDAISALARTYQLRLGPGRMTIDGDEPLSVRELEVLRLMVDGKNNPEIADTLFITRRTAAAHVSGIMRKLSAASRVEAVSEAHRRGLV